MKDLRECMPLMISTDFKDRTKAEYWELKIRCEKLEAMCKKYAAGELDFTPNCSLELLQEQLGYMQKYLGVLELRAEIEGIDLQDVGLANDEFMVLLSGKENAFSTMARGNSHIIFKALMLELAEEMAENKRDDVSDEVIIEDLVKCLYSGMLAFRESKKE